jgi:ankyrin repeat protein
MGKYAFYSNLTCIYSCMHVFFLGTALSLSCNNPKAWHAREALSNAPVCAASEGNIDVVKSLLDRERNANREDHDGVTLLESSVRSGHVPATHVLTTKGASIVTIRNFDAQFLLEMVARNGQPDAIATALVALSRE